MEAPGTEMQMSPKKRDSLSHGQLSAIYLKPCPHSWPPALTYTSVEEWVSLRFFSSSILLSLSFRLLTLPKVTQPLSQVMFRSVGHFSRTQLSWRLPWLSWEQTAIALVCGGLICLHAFNRRPFIKLLPRSRHSAMHLE